MQFTKQLFKHKVIFGIFVFSLSQIFAYDINWDETSASITEGSAGDYTYANLDITLPDAGAGFFLIEIRQQSGNNKAAIGNIWADRLLQDLDYMFPCENATASNDVNTPCGDNGTATWYGSADNDEMRINFTTSGATTITMSVRIMADERWEGGSGGVPEIFVVRLLEGTINGQDYEFDDGNEDMTISIVDDEAASPVIGFQNSGSAFTVAENSSINVIVEETGAVQVGKVNGTALTFDIEIANVSTVDADHQTTQIQTFTWHEWDATYAFNYNPAHEGTDEPQEELVINITGATNGSVDTGDDNKTGYITDSDRPPYVYFNQLTTQIDESSAGNSPDASIRLDLERESGFDSISVNYAVVYPASDPANGNNGESDHFVTGGTVTFGDAGATSANLEIEIRDDNFDEADSEYFIIRLTDGSNINVDSDSSTGNGWFYRISHTVEIQDDDNEPTVSFDGTSATNTEATTSPTITVNLSAASSKDITVDVTATGDGATDTDDFTLNSSTISIDAYESSGTVDLTIVNDDLFEDDENIDLAIAGNSNAGGSDTYTYTIDNDADGGDDAKPVLSFSSTSDTTINETNAEQTFYFGVSLNAATGKDVDFNYSVTDTDADNDGVDAVNDASGDFVLASGAGQIAASDADQTVGIAYKIVGDDYYELDKTITITLALSGGETDATLGTVAKNFIIVNDDAPPVIALAAATNNSDTGGNEGDASETITITKTGNTEVAASVALSLSSATAINDGTGYDDYDVSDADGEIDFTSAKTITFDAGTASKNITIAIDDDGLYEGSSDENFVLAITANGGGTETINGSNNTFTYTIGDNEAVPKIEFSASAGSGDESVTNPTINIQIDKESYADATVNYTVSAVTNTLTSDDYTLADGVKQIDAGDADNLVNLGLEINDGDNLFEDAEVIRITLSADGGCDCDLGDEKVFDYTINANGTPPTITFPAADNSANPAEEADGSVSVTLSLSATPGKEVSGTYTISEGTATSTGTSPASDGDDYTPALATGTFNFTPALNDGTAAESVDTTFTITLVEDGIYEGQENFSIALSGLNDINDGTDTEYTFLVNNSDAKPTVYFGDPIGPIADDNVAEDVASGTYAVPVVVSAVNEVGNVLVNYVITGIDEDDGSSTGKVTTSSGWPTDATVGSLSGQLDIDADNGVRTGAINFTITDDDKDEWDETIKVTLSLPGGGTNATLGGTDVFTLTIDDNDNAPNITFNPDNSGSSTNEDDAGTINFTDFIELSDVSGKNLQFYYDTEGANKGDATSTDDYTAVSGNFTINAGSTSPEETIGFDIVTDLIDEDNQTVVVDITVVGADENLDGNYTEQTGAGTATAQAGAAMYFTYTIKDDDDPPEVYFTNDDGDNGTEVGTVIEGQSKNIGITLSLASEKDITVYYEDAGTGDATNGTDYVTLDSTKIKRKTIPGGAGTTTSTISVTSSGDAIYEDDQTVVIALSTTDAITGLRDVISNISDNTDGNQTMTYTLTILDNNTPPGINFYDVSDNAASSSTVGEGDGTHDIYIGMDADSSEKEVTITYSVTRDSALSGYTFANGHPSSTSWPNDFWLAGYDNASETSVTIPVGVKSVALELTINPDNYDEVNEVWQIKLNDGTGGTSAPSNAGLGNLATIHTMTITDDDNAPKATFTSTTREATETDAAGTPFNLATIIRLVDDSDVETFSAKPLQLSITTEGGSKGTATLDKDYNSLAATSDNYFTISPGSSSPDAAINFTGIDDDIYEWDQTVIVTLGVIGADGTGDGAYDLAAGTESARDGDDLEFTYTMTDDDDAPQATISAPDYNVDTYFEADAQVLTVALSDTAERISRFNFTVADVSATKDTDYTIVETDLVFFDGDNLKEKTIAVTGIPDVIYEQDETFTVTMVADSNATVTLSEATVTLTDDETKPTIEFPTGPAYLNIDEDHTENGAESITITLSGQSKFETVITFDTTLTTATSYNEDNINYDYTLPEYGDLSSDATITIDALSTTTSFTYLIVDDNLVDDPENGVDEVLAFQLLSGGDYSTLTGNTIYSLNIEDNDSPPGPFVVDSIFTVSSDPSKVIQGHYGLNNQGFTIQVMIENEPNLDGGTIEIIAKEVSEADDQYAVLNTTEGAKPLIQTSELGKEKTFTISEEIFEADYGDGDTVVFSANIYDIYGNGTQGSSSSDTIIVDFTPPSSGTTGAIASTGGTPVNNYYNGTNTAVGITIPIASDLTLIGGQVFIEGSIQANSGYTAIGDTTTITGAEVSLGTLPVSLDSTHVNKLNYTVGDNLYFRSTVVDVAGNETVFSKSNTNMVADTVKPYIASTNSTEDNGRFKIGETLTFTYSYNENVQGDGSAATLYLNSGYLAFVPPPDSPHSSVSVDYVITEGDSANNLEIDSLQITFSTIKDAAGNSLIRLREDATNTAVVADGNNLSDSYNFIIDGRKPDDFTLATVTTLGDSASPTFGAYWNATNTSATAEITLLNDSSLIAGTIQMLGIIGATTSTIGSAVTILEEEINTSLIKSMDAADIEGIDGWAEDATVSFSARITDAAGNITDGTAAAQLTIDQIAPADSLINSITGDNVHVQGYLNSTNSILTFVSGLDPGDGTMTNGKVQLQTRLESGGGFNDLGTSITVTSGDISSESTSIEIDTSDIWAAASNGDILYFTSIVTDVAGNATIQSESPLNIIIDTVAHDTMTLSYSTPRANKDTTVTITATFPQNAYGFNEPTDTLPHLIAEFQSGFGAVDAPMTLGVDSTTWTYILDIPDNVTDEGQVLIYVSATDRAGNPLDSSKIGNKEGFVIDNTAPNITFTATNSTTADDPPNLGKGGDELSVKADWNEYADLTALPTVTATYFNGNPGGGFDEQSFVSRDDDSTWYYSFVLPTDPAADGIVTFTSSGSDTAQNNNFSYVTNNVFFVDNTAPIISDVTPAENAYVKLNEMQFGYHIDEGSNTGFPKIDSLNVLFKQVSGPGSDFNVEFDSTATAELDTGEHVAADIINQEAIEAGLVDSTVYNLIFASKDRARNIGFDTVNTVTYDISQPWAKVSFDKEYAVGEDNVTATVTFSEPVQAVPEIKFSAGPDVLPGATGDPANQAQTPMTATGDPAVWTAIYTIPGSPGNTEFDGYVDVWFRVESVNDLAGNQIRQVPDLIDVDSTIDSVQFINRLKIDNKIPEARFFFTNITDSTLSYNNDSSGIGIGTHEIRIDVIMNEPIAQAAENDTIELNYWYNADTSLGDTILNTQLFSIETILDGNDDPLYDSLSYFITLADSEKNDGILYAQFIAKDLAGNSVESFIGENSFKVDNIHPAPFTTGDVSMSGINPVQGWFNSLDSLIEMRIPIATAAEDSTLFQGGRVDLQLFNITRGVAWKTIAPRSSLEDSIISNGNDVKFIRDTTSIFAQMDPSQGELLLGDSLEIRAVVTDRNGNTTIGEKSVQKLVYDRDKPSTGALTSGIFYDADDDGILDSLISSDDVSLQWSVFTDQGDAEFASGTDRYELAIEKFGTDSINEFYGWDTVPFPSDPYELSLPFEYKGKYIANILAFDVAGNASDTLKSDTLYRYNSAPVFGLIPTMEYYEDTTFIDTTLEGLSVLSVTDPDISTILSDTLKYYIMSKTRTVGPVARDTNWINLDSLTGIFSGTPAQADTGVYEIIIKVADLHYDTTNADPLYNDAIFADTTTIDVIVYSVNDTPRVEILDPSTVLTWDEDYLLNPEDGNEQISINLSQYVFDPDNDSIVDMTWSYIVLDTIGLDKDYPLVNGFSSGPGSLKSPLVLGGVGDQVNQLAVDDISLGITIETSPNPQDPNDAIYAYFDSDSNFHGSDIRIELKVEDLDGAWSKDTIVVNVNATNDPPVISDIPKFEVLENDSLKIDFADYTYDIDDTLLTYTISVLSDVDTTYCDPEPCGPSGDDGIIGGNSGTFDITPFNYTSQDSGDTVVFSPSSLWSGRSIIQVVASDGNASATQDFIIDVIYVDRPDIEVAVLQNNAFSQFLQIMIIDNNSKTRNIALDIQNEDILIDTIAEYTYTANFDFAIDGKYNFEIIAVGDVGYLAWDNKFDLASAQQAARWSGSSSDGRFNVIGEPGSVSYDQSLLIVDSSLFATDFQDQASYSLANEHFQFSKAVEIRFGSQRDDLAIYRRQDGVIWKELPSLQQDGQIFTYSENAGYFKLGTKTIIVPEQTSIHQNYPNPFNPVTNIQYDIGLLDGLSQDVSINVYNLLGQHVRVLVQNQNQIGQHKIQWNGRDKFGESMPSGIYFVQLTTKTGIIKNKKMMLLK